MAFDLFKPGKLNQALKIGQLAYSQVSSIPAKLNEDKHEDYLDTDSMPADFFASPRTGSSFRHFRSIIMGEGT